MTIENDFLPFATGSGANVLDQSDYAALAALSTGYQAGIAQSAAVNKTWRQSSIMASVLAQFIVQQTGQAAIDDGTTATLLANLTAAVKASSSSAIGTIVNGTVNLTSASNSLTFKADQVIVGSALNGFVYSVPSVNLTINTATVGANGMNTGSPAVSGFVNVYLLLNPNTGASALLGVNDTGVVPPMVCAATGIPSGYTASALVGAYWTNGSGQFQPVMQYNRRIFASSGTGLSGAGTATLQGFVWAGVPSAAKTVSGAINITNTGSSSDTVALFPLSTGGPGSKGANRNSTTGGIQSPFSDLPINPATPRTNWYTISATGGSITVTVFSTDYTI
jgi:hypothetical protein